MRRNKDFHPSHQPFRSHQSLEIQHRHTSSPFSFLNPTRAYYRHNALSDQRPVSGRSGSDGAGDRVPGGKAKESNDDEQPASGVDFKWRSRDNRKGRHALVVQPSSEQDARFLTPGFSSSLRATAKGVLRMLTQYPYWDVSYLVATVFTLGSVLWVFNAFFVWLPLVKPSTEFKNEILHGGGITAFVGATIFEIGSILLMFEAVNENRSGCFGWALERVLKSDGEKGDMIRLLPDEDGCAHHHTNKGNLVGKGDSKRASSTASAVPSSIKEEVPYAAGDVNQGRSWIWFPSAHDLKVHYLRELGSLASFAQLCGATIFWISGFTALPGINNKMSQGLLDGVYWTPQTVGGTGFIISGVLFMLETQRRWYVPALGVLGWHIGFWNLVGAIGFTLCGALGPAYGNNGAQYEASLATFWGSWAFLIGSVIQWYESLDKFVVEEKRQRPVNNQQSVLVFT